MTQISVGARTGGACAGQCRVVLEVLEPRLLLSTATILTEGFEGAFPPASWTSGNISGSYAGSKWGSNSAKASAGSWSAFCADNGSDTRTVYDNDLNTTLRRGGISLAGYATATLTFDYWLNSETDYDFFEVNVRDDAGTWWNIFRDSGSRSSWQTKSISLGRFAGDSNVMISFDFISDGMVVPAAPSGVWLDNVSVVADTELGPRAWTVLVYMNADNNLGDRSWGSDPADDDLAEMQQPWEAAVPPDIHIAALADFLGPNNTYRGHVTSLAPVGEYDMGDPANLTSFITWAVGRYSAQHYALVLWDHGGGFDGFGSPEELEIPEIRQAIDASGVHFDLLGFDACLMAQTEVAYELRDVCDVFVGSQETEPGSGWNYSPIIDDLITNPTMSAVDLGRCIVSRSEVYSDCETMSATLTGSLGALATAMDNFAGTALAQASPAEWDYLRQDGGAAAHFADYRFADLRQFAQTVADDTGLRSSIRTAAGAIVTAVDAAVDDAYGGTGLTVFLPPQGDVMDGDYPPLAFAAATRWDDFVDELMYENLAPTDIALTGNTVAEHQAPGTAVGTFTATDPNPGDTCTFSLVAGAGGDDNASFTIVGGLLQTAATFNYETRTTYSIRVRATDGGGLYTEEAFTIHVTNVNEQPTDIALSNNVVLEQRPVGTTVGAFTTTDPDIGNAFTYTLVAGAGDSGNASFAVVGTTLRTAAIFERDVQSSYSIRIRSTDQGGLWVEKTFTIEVSDANHQPTDVLLTIDTIAENQPAGTRVGTLGAVDPDVGDTFTFALVAGAGGQDNASFAIDGVKLNTAAVLDYDTKSTYSILVRATDAGGLWVEVPLTIRVTNVNEPPTGVSLAGDTVAENVPVGTAVGALVAVDPDIVDTFTFTLVSGTGSADNASFTIAGGVLKTAVAMNYEVKNAYSIRVRVVDSGGLSAETPLTVHVGNVNEAPSSVYLTSAMVAENQASGTALTTFTTTDQDAGETFTYALAAGTGDDDNALFTVAGGVLTASVSFDYEVKSSYHIRVRSTDSGGLSVERPLVIAVTDVNDAPVIDDQALPSLAENSIVGRVAGTVAAGDQDAGQTIHFAIVAGNTGGAFSIHPTTGWLMVANSNALDFETTPTFTLTVQVTDSAPAPLSDTATVTVALSNVNEAPTNVTLTGGSVPENRPPGAPAGTFAATDPDAGEAFIYTLAAGTGGKDNALFTISGAELRTAASFDYETKKSCNIRVRATDAGGLWVERTMVVTVLDGNEPPTAIGQEADVDADTPLAITLTGQDDSTPAAGLTYTPTAPAHGTLTPQGGGVFLYSPEAGFVGVDGFSFTVTDTGEPGSGADPLTSPPAEVVLNVGWQMVLGAKAAPVTDADGDLVSISVKGGTGVAYFAHAGGCDPARIVVEGTDATSSLMVAVKKAGAGDGKTTIGSIEVRGSVNMVSGKTAALTGGMEVWGGLGSLMLDGVSGQVLANSHGLAEAGAKGAKLAFGTLADARIDMGGLAVSSLTAMQWLKQTAGGADAVADALVAPCVGQISTKAVTANPTKGIVGCDGNFQADLLVTGADSKGMALGSAKIAGQVACTWDFSSPGAGNVGSISAGLGTAAAWTLSAAHSNVKSIDSKAGDLGGTWEALTIGKISTKADFLASVTAWGVDARKGVSVGSLKAAAARGARLVAAGEVSGLMLAESHGSDFLAGVVPGRIAPGQHCAAGVDDFAGVHDAPPVLRGIKTLKISGRKIASDDASRFVTDSHFTAAVFGVVSLTNAETGGSCCLHVLDDGRADSNGVGTLQNKDTYYRDRNWTCRSGQGALWVGTVDVSEVS